MNIYVSLQKWRARLDRWGQWECAKLEANTGEPFLSYVKWIDWYLLGECYAKKMENMDRTTYKQSAVVSITSPEVVEMPAIWVY